MPRKVQKYPGTSFADSGAENGHPAKVENDLLGHPSIAAVAVIDVPDPRSGEAVNAIVLLYPGQSASAGEVIDHARQRIAGSKVSKSVDFVDVLPRSATGKVLHLCADLVEGIAA